MTRSGEEVKDLKTLSKIKSVEEMLPTNGSNQVNKSHQQIGEEQYSILEQALRLDCTIEDACMCA